jgi:hypothetical protein
VTASRPRSGPAASGPARAPQHSSAWILVLLVAGHVGVAVGIGVLAVQLVAVITEPAGVEPSGGSRAFPPVAALVFGAGLAAFVIGQVLSIRRLLGHLRPRRDPHRPGLDEAALVTGARRIEWPATLAFLALVLGMNVLTTAPVPVPLLALFCALSGASLLLDQAHAGWIHRHIDGRMPIRTLPDGSGARIRKGQRYMRIMLVVIATVVTLVVVVIVTVRPIDAGNAPLVAVLPIAAPLSVVLLALLLTRPALWVRRAIDGDVVHLPTLDSAARGMRGLGLLGALSTALTVAAILVDPTAPLRAFVLTVPLVFVLFILVMQEYLAARVHLGDTVPPPRWARRPRRSARSAK